MERQGLCVTSLENQNQNTSAKKMVMFPCSSSPDTYKALDYSSIINIMKNTFQLQPNSIQYISFAPC